jgi:signal recognition particle receptor subunit beta
MAQYNTEYFKKKFESRNAMEVVALRAAMRVLPVLAQQRRAALASDTHAVCRCFQSSAFVNSMTRDATDAISAARVAAGPDHAAAEDAATRTARATHSVHEPAILAAKDALTRADDVISTAAFAAAGAGRAAIETYYTVIYGAAAGSVYTARQADEAADASEAHNTAASAAASAAASSAAFTGGDAAAILTDIGRADGKGDPIFLLARPLWPEGMPAKVARLWTQLQKDLRRLDAGFQVWIDWYQDRLDGRPFDWEIERQWALLSKEQLSQSPAEINAYLKGLRDRTLSKELKRVRAIFIGHGEAGKTSLIRALHGEDVIQGQEQMTPGVAMKDAKMEEEAGVFTSVTNYKDDDLTVHFWDFGGQVMAHATHQFFLRSKCLYVIVLAGRAERNPNEEVEYWLEHVRAFGDNSPVLLVGNKADVMPVNLDLTTLKQKFPNIAGFHSLSCTQAKSAFRDEFELFRKQFRANLRALGQNVQHFSPEQFNVLKTIEQNAAQDDFLDERRFDKICEVNCIAMEGPGGRDSLLDIFDKLGIVMHFKRLPFLADYVLNPRWLTYGVYTIMYSKEAEAARGRLSEVGLVSIFKTANPPVSGGRALHYPADRCAIIANAMIAFRVAYRLGTGDIVIPALLPPEQPDHDFKPDGALAFRFDFGGFLPRHVLPALVVEQFQDIAKVNGREIIWQNGVLLRPRRQDSEAFVRADYHTRTIDILVKGTDAPLYLGMLRDSILATLEKMPQLPFEEKVELRADMRTTAVGPVRPDSSVWIDYEIIQATIRSAFVRRKDPSQRAVRSWGQGRCAGTIIFCASSRDGQQSNSQVVPSVTSHPVCGLFAVRGTPGSDWDCPRQVGDKTRRLSCFMGHTTAPTGRIAIERSPPNTPTCPKQPQTNFFDRITFASPRTTKTSPSANCAHWSESRLLRWPPAQTCQARRRSPTTPASRYFNAELLQVAHRISCLAPGHHSTITKPLPSAPANWYHAIRSIGNPAAGGCRPEHHDGRRPDISRGCDRRRRVRL